MIANLVAQTLRHAWLTLEPFNFPMAVMGGIALARWRHVRATRDVDLLLAIDPSPLEKVTERLVAAGFHQKHPRAVVQLGSLRLVQFLYEPPQAFVPIQVDLLIAGSQYHRKALERRIAANLPGIELSLSVLTCEDLILHKLLAGRLIDLADAAALLRANHAALDMTYLGQWVVDLGVSQVFATARAEAFPNE